MVDEILYKEIAEDIKIAKNIMVLTGAGMSTESGIPDFRSQNGLYKNVYRAEEILSHEFFFKKPMEFYDFLKTSLSTNGAEPNIGHEMLAKWEEQGYVKSVVTQNIDGLHQKAGSKNVIEMHGNIITATCQNCGKKYFVNDIMNKKGEFYYCDCKDKKSNNIIKPDVVLYGENVPNIELAFNMISSVDLLIVLGTSLVVYPVAAIPSYLKSNSKMLIINYSKTPYDENKNCITIHDGIGDTLSIIDKYL